MKVCELFRKFGINKLNSVYSLLRWFFSGVLVRVSWWCVFRWCSVCVV